MFATNILLVHHHNSLCSHGIQQYILHHVHVLSHILTSAIGILFSAVEMLRTDADIIIEIPKQTKVTHAMLVSAQNWVAKAMAEEWYVVCAIMPM